VSAPQGHWGPAPVLAGADPENSARGGRIMASAGAQAYLGVWGLAPNGIQLKLTAFGQRQATLS